jgi:hypothetical protein
MKNGNKNINRRKEIKNKELRMAWELSMLLIMQAVSSMLSYGHSCQRTINLTEITDIRIQKV